MTRELVTLAPARLPRCCCRCTINKCRAVPASCCLPVCLPVSVKRINNNNKTQRFSLRLTVRPSVWLPVRLCEFARSRVSSCAGVCLRACPPSGGRRLAGGSSQCVWWSRRSLPPSLSLARSACVVLCCVCERERASKGGEENIRKDGPSCRRMR
jgi:hypothetical protein